MITGFLISILTSAYKLVYNWGYLGMLFISFVESASFIPIPTSSGVLLFVFGAILNPFLLALSAALGGSLGQGINYLIGLGGKEILPKKYTRELEVVRKKFEKYGASLWIIIASMTPFPDAIIAIFCGVIKYDFKRYFLALFVGRLILCLFFTMTGYYSLMWVMGLLNLRFPI